MKRKSKFSPAMYQFLSEGGYLERGEGGIAEGKKEYRRVWMRKYKARYRAEAVIEHTVACHPEQEAALAKAAKEYGYSIPEFLRFGALAFYQKVYLVPNISEMYQVRQELIYLRSQIERVRQGKRGLFEKDRDAEIERLLKDFQASLNKAFKQPDDIQELVLLALHRQPNFVEWLRKTLSEHASKEQGNKDS